MNHSVPVHIGIIMDGNRRWAVRQNLAATQGHKEGLVTAKTIVQTIHDYGVVYLTLFTFSTENWKRTEEEVSFLMNLLRNNLRKEYDFYRANDIRVLHSGDLHSLPNEIREEIYLVEQQTKNFNSLTVNLAINYGGRDEIIRACKLAIADGITIENLNESHINKFLDHPEIPDLDLIIRTGGEQRLSNFMLWRSSYSEIYFTDTLWPDFTPQEFHGILEWYTDRERRFGGSSEIN